MNNLFSIAIAINVVGNAIKQLSGITQQAERLEQNIGKVAGSLTALKRGVDNLERAATSMQGLAAAATYTGMFEATMHAFTELEDASLGLKSTMMEAGGIVPEVFREIDKEAMRLGTELKETSNKTRIETPTPHVSRQCKRQRSSNIGGMQQVTGLPALPVEAWMAGYLMWQRQ